MELLYLLLLFVGFGFMVGVLFGFFGMGGSFLVTPTLLVMGYPARVAVGSGMAFVFGTAIIATLKHHDLGQVDYKLGGLMIVGTSVGIEVGRLSVFYLEGLGLASGVIGVTYVVMLGSIGLFVTATALREDRTGDHHSDSPVDLLATPNLANRIQSSRIPPMLSIRGGIEVSLWIVLLVSVATGILSGFLGVGGGFIRMPAMVFLIGVPVPVAIGTDLFEIVISGGVGTFLYGMEGGVDLSIVAPLLGGGALGARIGSGATGVVDTDAIQIYFGLMLLGGSIAVAFQQLGVILANELFATIGLVLIVLSAFLVSGAVLYTTAKTIRTTAASAGPATER